MSTDIHQSVSEHYARAVKNKTDAVETKSCSCCGPAPGDLGGEAAKLAGYTADDLSALPEAAVASSFGCGNPLAFAGVKEGDVVLDLGSGAGLDLLIAAEKVGASGKVIGIDMTDEMIEQARRNIERAGVTTIDVRKGLIEDMPVDAGSVDWVISNCVINLSPDKPKVFSEIARVLKPGGKFAVSDIVAERIPEAIRSVEGFYNMCVGGAISEAAYVKGLEDAGLADVKVEERLVYDAATIKGFLEMEIEDEIIEIKDALGADAYEEIVTEMDGKIWSAKFVGTKQATRCC